MLSLLLARTNDSSVNVSDAVGANAMLVLWLAMYLVWFGFFLWGLIDVISRDFPDRNIKILWIILIILLGGPAAILYLIFVRKKGTIPVTKKP